MGTTSISSTAKNIRVWDKQEPGLLWVGASYTKNDERIAKLVIKLLDTGSNLIDDVEVDVSSTAVGGTANINVSLQNNDLSSITKYVESYQEQTISAGGTLQLTAPSDSYYFIEDVDGAIQCQDLRLDWYDGTDVKGYIVFPGETINLLNQDSSDHTIRIYTIPQTEITLVDRVLVFEEQDSGGNVIHSGQITVQDIPPVIIEVVNAGQITIDALG